MFGASELPSAKTPIRDILFHRVHRGRKPAAVELAWLWLRYQPDSALVRWFHGRVGTGRRRVRKVLIVALARRLLIALWRYATQGVLPEDASLKAAV